jgi:hypothetical protein
MTAIMQTYVLSHKVFTTIYIDLLIFGFGDSLKTPIFGRVFVELPSGNISSAGQILSEATTTAT